jgi:hypothetical protein
VRTYSLADSIVCVQDYKVPCIAEMWLHISFYNHNLFSDTCSVFGAGTDFFDCVYHAVIGLLLLFIIQLLVSELSMALM